jgi:hypothetical protein
MKPTVFPHRALARLMRGRKLNTASVLVALRTLAAHGEIRSIPYYCITMAVVDRYVYPSLYVDTDTSAKSFPALGVSSLVIPFRTDADGDILGLVEWRADADNDNTV